MIWAVLALAAFAAAVFVGMIAESAETTRAGSRQTRQVSARRDHRERVRQAKLDAAQHYDARVTETNAWADAQIAQARALVEQEWSR